MQKAYLLTSLHLLTQRLLKSSTAPAPLLATELALLASHRALHALLPFAQTLPQLAAKYTAAPRGRPSPRVWLARLEVEKALDVDADRRERTRKEARAAVHGEGVVDVWLWGLDTENVRDEAAATQALARLEVRPAHALLRSFSC